MKGGGGGNGQFPVFNLKVAGPSQRQVATILCIVLLYLNTFQYNYLST